MHSQPMPPPNSALLLRPASAKLRSSPAACAATAGTLPPAHRSRSSSSRRTCSNRMTMDPQVHLAQTPRSKRVARMPSRKNRGARAPHPRVARPGTSDTDCTQIDAAVRYAPHACMPRGKESVARRGFVFALWRSLTAATRVAVVVAGVVTDAAATRTVQCRVVASHDDSRPWDPVACRDAPGRAVPKPRPRPHRGTNAPMPPTSPCASAPRLARAASGWPLGRALAGWCAAA